MAKGARRDKNPLSSILEPGNLIQINCILKENSSYEFKLKKINIDVNFENRLNENLFIKFNTVYSETLEEMIRKYPEQYFWFHKKWDRTIYR